MRTLRSAAAALAFTGNFMCDVCKHAESDCISHLQGDSRDMALMALSISVFVWISMHLMHLYATYALVYNAGGVRQMSQFMH